MNKQHNKSNSSFNHPSGGADLSGFPTSSYAPSLCPSSVASSAFVPLVFFGGYSGSGKTTHCIPILQELGYQILSSSVLLHDFSEKLLEKVLGVEKFNSYDRNCQLDFQLKIKRDLPLHQTMRCKRLLATRASSLNIKDRNSRYVTKARFEWEASHSKAAVKTSACSIRSRKLLIDLAEKALVPVFSRGVFSHAIADRIIKSKEQKIAVEVFNQEEFNILRDRLASVELSKAVSFNLRRQSENSGADERDLLLAAINIDNNSSYANLRSQLSKLLAFSDF